MRHITVLHRWCFPQRRATQPSALLQDRRGAATLMFSISAVALIGIAGLATEGGSWYLEKRHGQNAADAAAIAGALALAQGGGSAQASSAAFTVAAANNYVAGTSNGTTTGVTVTPGNYSGGTFAAGGTPLNAVQAVVTRSPPRLFSALFLGSNPNIAESALAVLGPGGNSNACVLAGARGLHFGGSTSITLKDCSMASNATGSNSVSVNGNSALVSGGTVVSAGGCSTNFCGNLPNYMMYQPPTTNPFNSIYDMTTGTGLTMPTFSGSKCLSIPTSGPVTLQPWTSGNQVAYCGSGGNSKALDSNKLGSVTFVPGTYFFQNASISFLGGTVTCSGCTPGGAGVTIILTGTNSNTIGSISIGGSATVTLNAPATSSYNPDFNGVLFYMSSVARPTNSCGASAPVSILGNSNIQLTGGMYFPTVNVCYSGNVSSATASTACTEIVGDSITFTGNSTLNITGCAGDGTQVAQVESVQLVQ